MGAEPDSPRAAGRLVWFDVLRGLVMLWILLIHYVSDTGGVLPVGPDLVDSALDSAHDFGNLIVSNGYYGAHLFLFASGAGLAISRARRGIDEPARPGFWRERLTRLGVGYAVALPLIFGALAIYALWRGLETDTGLREQFEHGGTLASAPYPIDGGRILAGLLFVPRLTGGADVFQSPPPSAWFLVPLLQLYVLFPALWWLRRRIGAVAFVLVCFAAAYGFRELALDQWGYHWTIVLGPARLAEFALGVALGPVLWKLRSPWLLLLAPVGIALWLQGAHDEVGQVPRSGVLVAAGLPIVVIALSVGLARVRHVSGGLAWMGQRSLELLLVQDVVRFFVATWLSTGHGLYGIRGPLFALFVALVLALALGFGRASDWVERRVGVSAARS